MSATGRDRPPPPPPDSGVGDADEWSQETVALEKHSCPACGASAEWNPGKRKLICPYCGTQSPYELDRDRGKVREIDLVRTLREMPEELRGWKAEKRTVRCRSCRAVSVFDPERVGQNCEFCGSPELVDYDEIKPPIRPQSILPFKVDERRVRALLRRWLGSKWLAPGQLKRKALVDQVHGVYLPYWTFDTHARCPWQAESGTYYYVSESYRDEDGRRRTRQVRKVRWSPASGTLDHFFDDEPVPGTQGIPLDLLRQVEPFPTADLVPYETAFLSGFVVEHYQVVLIDAARASREQMEGKLYRLCAREIPGDTYRNLRIAPSYSGQTFKHVLVPVWHLTYDYHGEQFHILANGATGRIAGRYPRSWWKICLLVLVAVVVVSAVVFLS